MIVVYEANLDVEIFAECNKVDVFLFRRLIKVKLNISIISLT